MEREELDIHIRELQAKADAFFAQAGKEPLEVYRIEKFEPVRQDPQFHGKFFEGDSYVVLKQNEKDYDIHYWHGKTSSMDEQATSAAFTVQLSEKLKFPSRHHLELMMEESTQFLSYFKGGIFYLEGGVESGLKHVEPKTYEKKLYIVKGKRYPRVWTKEIKADSLNEGDVFILDLGMKLYFWPGKECNVNEKVKGMEVLFNIKNAERGSLPKHYYPREDSLADEEFWAELGGRPDTINPAIPDDGVQEGSGSEADTKYSLYRVSNESGKLETFEVTDRPLKKEHLDTNDTFILELHDKIYVWIGKGANLEEKKSGMLIAKDFITQKGKPSNTKITRLPEFGEDVHFKSFFAGFYPCVSRDAGRARQLDESATATGAAEVEKLANQQRQAAKQLFDKLGADYQMNVYYCHWESGQVYPLDKEEWGAFYSDEIYLIDLKGKNHRYIIMWIGPHLSLDQYTETSKFFDVLTNYENSWEITRVRIRRGHEEESLLSLFPGGFVINMGSRIGSLAERAHQIKSQGTMFKIFAPYGDSAKAIEQESVKCENLNSGDAFIICPAGAEVVYLWMGAGANETEQKVGRSILNNYFSELSLSEVVEGEEPESFWSVFPEGRTEYSSIKNTGIPMNFEARLFHASNAMGYFHVQVVPNFTQDDMLNDDIMILDAYSTIYVWIGNGSNKFEKNGAYKTANRYIESINDDRDKSNVQIVEVEAGRELPGFTVHFPEWRAEIAQRWLDDDPAKRLADLYPADKGTGVSGGSSSSQNSAPKKPFVPGKPAATAPAAPSWAKKEATQQEEVKKAESTEDKSKYLDPATNKMSYEQLKGVFPQGVDPARKEAYLTDEQFQEVFGMSPTAFNDLKQWKKNDLKKAKGLF